MTRRAPLLLFAGALAAYAYFYQAGGWNQNSRFDLVRAVVEQGTARIDRYHANTGDKSCRGPAGRCVKARAGDHYYCDKAPGASWLAVPVYAAIRAVAGASPPSERALAASSHAATVAAVALPCALAVAALFGLLAALGHSPRRCLVGAAGLGLGTLAFPYATLFYGHALAGALLVLGFGILVRGRAAAEPLSPLRLALAGLALGAAVVVEYPAALAVLPILLYAAWWLRPARRLAWIAAGMAIPAIACAVYHQMAFGSPLALPYDFSTQPHRSQGFFMGLGLPQPEALHGILISSYRGLFWSAPWLLGAIPGAVAMFRSPRWRPEAAVCVAVIALFVWLNASLVDWQGGWAMGARYLVPSLPFWVILAVAAPDAFSRGRRVLVAIGLAALVYSGAAMLAGTAVRPEVPVTVRRPFGSYLWPRWFRGELAVNNQSIDRPAGSGRPRAYNLGQLAGLRGGWSLLPLGLILGGVGAGLVRATRVTGSRR